MPPPYHPYPRPYPWVYARPVQAPAGCCPVVRMKPGRGLVACGGFFSQLGSEVGRAHSSLPCPLYLSVARHLPVLVCVGLPFPP